MPSSFRFGRRPAPPSLAILLLLLDGCRAVPPAGYKQGDGSIDSLPTTVVDTTDSRPSESPPEDSAPPDSLPEESPAESETESPGESADDSPEDSPEESAVLPSPCDAVSRFPERWALDVGRSAEASVVFGDDLDAGTVHDASFVVTGDVSGVLPGTVRYETATREAIFTPVLPAHPGERLTAVVSTAVACADGSSAGPLVWTWTAATDAGSGVFSQADDTPTADYTYGLVAHDLDGDGILEIVTNDAEANQVSVVRGTPGAYAVVQQLSVPTYPWSLDGADMDGDGDVDVLVAEYYGMDVLFNDGGTLRAPVVYDAGCYGLTSVRAGDFDADGDLDVIAAGYSGYDGDAVTVFENDGAGILSVLQTTLLDRDWDPYGIDLGDFDGDDDLDAIMLVGYYDAVLLSNDGTGQLTAGSLVALADTPKAVYINDLDGDGDADAAVPTLYGETVFLVAGDGAGGLAPVAIGTVSTGHGICGGDFDSDGDIDLAVPTFYAPGTLQTWTGDGAGSFALSGTAAMPHTPAAVVCADLDGNGSVDVAVAAADTGGSSSVVTLLNGG